MKKITVLLDEQELLAFKRKLLENNKGMSPLIRGWVQKYTSTGPISKVVVPKAPALDVNSPYGMITRGGSRAEPIVTSFISCQVPGCRSKETTLVSGEESDNEGFQKKYSKWLCVKHQSTGV